MPTPYPDTRRTGPDATALWTEEEPVTDIRRLPGPDGDRWEWQLRAACRGLDSALFFHPDGERGAARADRENGAKAICAACPVVRQCRAHALIVREPYGIWGGLTEAERDHLQGGRRRGVAAGRVHAAHC